MCRSQAFCTLVAKHPKSKRAPSLPLASSLRCLLSSKHRPDSPRPHAHCCCCCDSRTPHQHCTFAKGHVNRKHAVKLWSTTQPLRQLSQRCCARRASSAPQRTCKSGAKVTSFQSVQSSFHPRRCARTFQVIQCMRQGFVYKLLMHVWTCFEAYVLQEVCIQSLTLVYFIMPSLRLQSSLYDIGCWTCPG